MSEDRTKKDPLLGGLDGMRAGQHWEGEPESLRHLGKAGPGAGGILCGEGAVC